MIAIMKRKKTQDRAAVNSELIRRPIRRAFPAFLLPTFAAFCIGFIYPFCKGVYLSFCKFTTTSDAKWIGLENYSKALKYYRDPEKRNQIMNQLFQEGQVGD